MSGLAPDVPSWLRAPAEGFLAPHQQAQLDAIFLRLLPGDPGRHVPSAVKVRASHFVSQLLARDATVYAEIPAWRALYPAMLGALDQYARAHLNGPLSAIEDAAMNEMLAGLEQGRLPDLPASLDQKLVFKTLLRHCYQGCFGDPRWGGNAEAIMWRALGYLQPAQDGLA